MVRTHRKSALASAGGALAVGMTALAGLTLTATSGIAAESAVKTEKIVVKRFNRGEGMTAENLDAVVKAAQKKCGANVQSFEAHSGSYEKGEAGKLRMVVCNKDGGSPVDRLAALEKARASLATSNDVPAENRAKILEVLDGTIAKLKAQ